MMSTVTLDLPAEIAEHLRMATRYSHRTLQDEAIHWLKTEAERRQDKLATLERLRELRESAGPLDIDREFIREAMAEGRS